MTQTVLEYIWLDSELKCRSKTKIIPYEWNISTSISVLPVWNYDGSSTCQATTEDSEIIIKPVKICKDPFRRHTNSMLVLCETYDKNNNPHKTNNRSKAVDIFSKKMDEEPMLD